MKKRGDGDDVDEFGLSGRPAEVEEDEDVELKPPRGDYLSWEEIRKLAGEPSGIAGPTGGVGPVGPPGLMTASDKARLDALPSKRVVPRSSNATMMIGSFDGDDGDGKKKSRKKL